MPTQIALVRGINVGGNKMVAMADLRDLVATLGYERPRTLLQSGNLVFSSKRPTGASLEKLLEAETEKRLGVSVSIVARGADEWQKIIDRNPFPDEAKNDPGHLVVMCLKTAVPAAKIAALCKAIVGREVIRADGKQLYITYPDGMGRSKLTGALIEKTLNTRGTARNWNTVLKIAAALDA